MGGLRVALAAILALGIVASGATSVSANDTPNSEEAIAPGPGLADLHQAIDDFRSALAELRGACRAERAALSYDVATARKRPPKGETECEKNLKQLKAEFQTIKQQALELEAKYRADVVQRRQDAEKAAKQKEEAAKQKLADEQKKATANKPVTAPADELARYRAKLQEQLKQVDATVLYKQGLYKQSVDAAAEYRAKAATLTGADREKYLAKAAQADKDAAQWLSYVKDYTAQHEQLVAALAKLGTAAAPAPKHDETAAKRAQLEQALKELNAKITYKWGESDRYAAMAADLRTQAQAATGELQAKLVAKAAEADKAAGEWAALARQYEDQRDQVQAQLDALAKT